MWWKTLGLLAVFGGMLYFAVQTKDEPIPDEEADRQLIQLAGFSSPDDIVEVTVRREGGETFTLTRDLAAEAEREAAGEEGPELRPAGGEATMEGAIWDLTEPMETATDDSATPSYVLGLLTAKATQLYGAEQAAALSEADRGLDDPVATLILKGRDGQTSEIAFGQQTPDQEGVYAQVAGQQTLPIFANFFVDANLKDKDLGDLRDKDLLAFAPGDVKSVTLEYPSTTLTASRDGAADPWTLETPDRTLPADAATLDSLLSSLSSARIDTFLGDPEEVLEPTGLDKPRITVTLGLGDKGEMGLVLGDTKLDETAPDPMDPSGFAPDPAMGNEKLFVQRKGDGEVLTVPGSLYDTLLLGEEDLRDKTLLAFQPAEATGLSYEWEGQTVALVKQPGDDGPGWVLEQPVELPADEGKVTEFLDIVERLRATGFVDEPGDLAQYGLDAPRGRIQVTTEGEDLPELLIGKEAADGTGLFMKRADTDLVYKVRASFAQDIETNPDRLRDLLVAEFDRTLVEQITLEQKDGTTVTLEAVGDNDWKVTAPEEKDADAGKVASVLTALEALRADVWVSDDPGAAAEVGLDEPDAIATVTLRGGETVVVKAVVDEETGFAAFMQREGNPTVFKSDDGYILTDLQKGPDDFEPMDMNDFGGGMPMM